MDYSKFLSFNTIDEGELLLLCLKLEHNVYYTPIDYTLIYLIKKKIADLNKTFI